MKPIELAEVVEEFSQLGITFEVGKILIGEYLNQGVREPSFQFPVTLSDVNNRRAMITIPMSSKKLIPVLDGLTL